MTSVKPLGEKSGLMWIQTVVQDLLCTTDLYIFKYFHHKIKYKPKKQNSTKRPEVPASGAGIAQWYMSTRLVIERSWVRIPAGAVREFSSPGSTFCADSDFGIRSTPVLPQYHLKDPSHSAKSAGGRLQLNTHTPYVCGFAWSDMVHGCMVYTELAPRRLQFHAAPAMPALSVQHFGGYSKNVL